MTFLRLRGLPARLFLLALVLIYAIPLYWLLATSLKSPADLASDPSGLIFAPTLQAFQAVWSSSITAAYASFEIAVGTTVVVVILACLTTYGLTRSLGRRAQLSLALGVAVLVTLHMVPQPTSVIPLYALLADWHLTNTIPGVIVADVALELPFAVLLLRPFFLGVPRDLEDAARVDGATNLVVFWRIVLPLVRNGLFTVAALTFMIIWGEFIYAISFLNDPNVYPVSALLAQQISLISASWNDLMAIAVLTSVPILIVFVVSQRRLVESVTLGAVR